MSVKDEITNNSERTIEAYEANAAFGTSGTQRITSADGTVTYNFSGFIVEVDAEISDVSGFDAACFLWATAGFPHDRQQVAESIVVCKREDFFPLIRVEDNFSSSACGRSTC